MRVLTSRAREPRLGSLTVSASLAAVALLAILHVSAERLRFLDAVPRSRWMSAAGGISVAYVVVHLLPELARGQESVDAEGILGFVEDHVYIVALIGLAVFYGVELASRRSASRPGTMSAPFVLSMSSFAVYNGIVGYLVVHREDTTRALAFFVLALGLHFVVNDHALQDRHRESYQRYGRWLLIAALAIGWIVGQFVALSEPAVGLLVAFLAGGVILNVLKEELPEERQSSFTAFVAAAAGYTVLLQLA